MILRSRVFIMLLRLTLALSPVGDEDSFNSEDTSSCLSRFLSPAFWLQPGFIYMLRTSVFPLASWRCTIKKKCQLTSCIVIQIEARQWGWFAGVRLREARLILSGPRSAPQASSFSNMVSQIAHRGITKHTPVTSQQHSDPAMNTPGINT